MSFSIDISKFTKGAIGEADRIRRAVVIELFSSTIEDTPVGNPQFWKSPAPPGYVGGRLRGNWQTNVRAPIDTVIDRIDKSGTRAKQGVTSNLGKFGDTVHMTNNLPYAEPVELGWSRRQAPAGMMRKNFTRVAEILRRKARGV